MMQNQATQLTAIAILLSSFLGSLHCTAMCGPIAGNLYQRKKIGWYHLGRLISYTSLGAISGLIGNFFLNSEFIQWRIIAVITMSLILIISGVNQFFPKLMYQFSSLSRLIQLINRLTKNIHVIQFQWPALIIGLLTIMLPCGWLYTYVIAASSTQSPYAGALVMFLFWLGGLPAVSAVPMMLEKTINIHLIERRKIAGAILILSGIYSILAFYLQH